MAPAVEDAVAPLGRPVTVNDLPMAWRSRVDTPLLKPQGAAGAQLGADATAELSRRGLSATDALDAIAKNPRLTPNVRLQLREALLTALGQQ